ncbi:ethanolamine utilization protein [Aminipila luticellarii]|uniref:Ethanolamine utilization protein n=1 Tax=Aminipila luticellarii TaxID=2507160 RepID=A0A410PTY1_9FIRM|nr:ethanolamine utilization protein [Aminipila luticellarii]QAT42369.1 ethanolamine utilization protein [Aminipila luticellarii]
MKFITEEDLRDLYRSEPFTTYEMEPGTRLTPGARQFLADRGINMFDDQPFVKKYVVTTSEDATNVKAEGKNPEAGQKKQISWKEKKLYCKMKSMEALFLSTGQELLSKDVFLAQSVINLGKQFAGIRAFAEGKGLGEVVCCQECSGMNGENFCEDMEDCFDITEFHMQLEKGKEILSLHKLRCALREVEPAIMEAYEDQPNEMKRSEEMIGKVNKIVNALSQMICSAVGGKECQKKT